MAIMVVGYFTKRFSEIYYTLAIFSTNVSNYIVERTIIRLGDTANFPMYFFGTILFNSLIHFTCVYIFIGLRVHLLKDNPKFDLGNSADITQYISLRSRLKHAHLIEKFNAISSSNGVYSYKPGSSQTKSGASGMSSFKASNSNIKSSNPNIRASNPNMRNSINFI